MSTPLKFRIFILFSLGYFVSFAFRGANIGFAPFLTQELSLNSSELGFLSSVYFLGFAVAQLPAGILLDRYGVRKVTAAMMLFAVLGAVIFANAHSLLTLTIGRLLIGLGVSVCLGGAFKALAQTFAHHHLPLLNGMVMAIGGMGGVLVGSPLTWLLTLTSWRMVSLGMAGVTLLVAALLYLGGTVPHAAASGQARLREQVRGMGEVLKSRAFWRIASLCGVSQGVFYAMQSLWLGAYLRDVVHADPAQAAEFISIVGVAMMAGCLFLGALARYIGRWLSLHAFAGLAMMGFIVVQLLILLQVPLPQNLLWACYGVLGSSGILCYADLPKVFPSHIVGRVSMSLNFVIFMFVLAFQVGVGAVLNLWPAQQGQAPASAHWLAWGILIAFQLVAAFYYCRKPVSALSKPLTAS